MEKSKVIFGNVQSGAVYKKAVKSKAKYAKKFGDDSDRNYSARVVDNEYIGDMLGVKNIAVGDAADGTSEGFDQDKGIIVGNIRMGFGHYRISMAIASAANALGYVPYWMDLNSYKETTCTKVISAQNDLYVTIVADIEGGTVQMTAVLGGVPVVVSQFGHIFFCAEYTRHDELMQGNTFDLQTVVIGSSYIVEKYGCSWN